MTIAEITRKYLEENGFDGLTGNSCGCSLDDLFNCSPDTKIDCEPGYKVPCNDNDDENLNCEGDCDWHIATKKR